MQFHQKFKNVGLAVIKLWFAALRHFNKIPICRNMIGNLKINLLMELELFHSYKEVAVF